MRECVIFGCGRYGDSAYNILKNKYSIIYWTDNNSKLWGKKKNNIEIIEPDKLSLIDFDVVDLFICISKNEKVIGQLSKIGIERWFIYKNSLFFAKDLKPDCLVFNTPHVGSNIDKKLKVLFVSNSANIRDHKMAWGVKQAGHRVYLAYLKDDPFSYSVKYAKMYEEIYCISSFDDLLNFISNSDFDIIHSSSEPEYVTALMCRLQIPVVLDCHDLRSSSSEMSSEELMMEYLIHKESDGIIYPTYELRNEAVKKYGIDIGKTYVIENYISKDLITNERKKKISLTDGRIHCVYEGGLAFDNRKDSYKYCTDNWIRLAQEGIVIHFYSHERTEDCNDLAAKHDNIVYEGNCSSQELAVELSQYDVGLCLYNLESPNSHYLECSSPNKLYEYLNAGLPVIVSDIKGMRDIVENNGFGARIDWSNKLYDQIESVAQIRIEKDALQKRKMVFEDKIPGLIEFYRSCIKRKLDL